MPLGVPKGRTGDDVVRGGNYIGGTLATDENLRKQREREERERQSGNAGAWDRYNPATPAEDPYFEERRQQLEDEQDKLSGRTAPRVGETRVDQGQMVSDPVTVDRSGLEEQTRVADAGQTQQQANLDAWAAMAAGMGPSAAGQMIARGEAANRAQLGLLASRRGSGTGLDALRDVSTSQARTSQDLQRQAGIIRTGERLAAVQGWEQAATSMVQGAAGLRAQDAAMARLDAQLELARQQGNQEEANRLLALRARLDADRASAQAELDLKNQAQIDAMTQFYVSQGMSQEAANRQAMMDWAKIRAQQEAAEAQREQSERESRRARAQAEELASAEAGPQIVGAWLEAAGGVAAGGAGSDIRMKQEIRSDRDSLRSMFAAMARGM